MRTIVGCALVLLVGCGAAPQTPASESGAASAAAQAEAAPAAEPGGTAASPARAPETAPAAAGSESQALARDLLKSGGRRIGWSATKKGFVLPARRRVGASMSLDLVFVDDAGHARETLKICGAPECDEQMAERAAEAMPALAARLEREQYAPVRAIGWPAGRDELEVSSLNMKLHNKGGSLEGLHEGKPAARIGTVRPPVVIAIFVVPDAKRLGVISAASADAQEPEQSFSVLPLP